MAGDDNESRYNPVFELRVDAADDQITDYVFYGLYKQRKREWLLDFRRDKGRRPSDQKVADYNDAASRAASLGSWRDGARAALDSYAKEIVEAESQRLREAAVADALFGRADALFRSVTLSPSPPAP